MSEYIIDKEFKELIPPLQKDEYENLQDSIISEGCRHPIIVWGKTILDGHNRYEICSKKRISFKIEQIKDGIINDRSDALLWIIKNQVSRRNLSDIDRIAMGKRYEDLIAPKAKEHLKTHTEKGYQPLANLPNAAPIHTRKEVAKLVGTSERNYDKGKKILEETPELQDDIRNGKISIHKAYNDIRHKEKVKENIKLKEESKKLETDKLYDIILADPPWKYEFSKSNSRSIEAHYPEMELNAIKEIKIPARKDSVLFLWATNPKLEEAIEVIKSWGFDYKTNMVWVKDKIGMGYYARSQHELLLIATKGKPQTPDEKNRPSSVINAIRKEHSKKPVEVYELIEQMYPEHDYLEMFARNKRNKWDSWGNQL